MTKAAVMREWAWKSKTTGLFARTRTQSGWGTIQTAPTRSIAMTQGINRETHTLVRVEIREIKQKGKPRE